MIRLFITFVALFASADKTEAWTPTGAGQGQFTRACHPQLWRKAYLTERNSDQRRQMLEQFLNTCAEQARAHEAQGAMAEVQMTQLRSEPRLRQWLEFLDRQGQVQAGWLYLQPDKSRHGMVVMACDFVCDPEANPYLEAALMQIYDEGRSHVFLVRSPEAQALQTGQWLGGGLSYGRDLLEAGAWLQLFSPERHRISSAHVFGQGWAAHAVLIAELYNDHNPVADDRKVFHSAVALCPAVNLEKLLHELDHPLTPQSSELRIQVQGLISALAQKFSLWQKWFGVGAQFLSEPWVFASLEQAQTLHWLKPFSLGPPRTPAQWLEANDFAYQSLGLQTPAWVLGSSGDPRYPAADHWRPLGQQHRDPKKSELVVHGLEDATTCAWSASHGWSFTSNLVRTLLEQEAYDIWPRSVVQNTNWPWGSPALGPNEIHLDQEWLVDESGIHLVYWIGQPNGQGLILHRRQEILKLGQSDLEPLIQVAWEAPARATRQLNARLRLYGPTEPLVHSRQSATRLEIE